MRVARHGPALQAGPPAPLRWCPGKTWSTTAEINISARPDTAKAAVSRLWNKGHGLCVRLPSRGIYNSGEWCLCLGIRPAPRPRREGAAAL